MASIEGTQLFLNEMSKADQKLQQAMRDARNAEQDVINNKFKALQLGKVYETDNVTGQGTLRDLTPGEIAAQQLAENLKAKVQLAGELAIAQSDEYKALEEINRASQVEGIKATAGASMIGQAQAELDPVVTKAAETRIQRAIDAGIDEKRANLIFSVDPKSKALRDQQFEETRERNKVLFADQLSQSGQVTAQELQNKMLVFDELQDTIIKTTQKDPERGEMLAQFLEAQEPFRGMKLSVQSQEDSELLRRNLKAEVGIKEAQAKEVAGEGEPGIEEIQQDIAVQGSFVQVANSIFEEELNVNLDDLDDLAITDTPEAEELVKGIKDSGGFSEIMSRMKGSTGLSDNQVKKRLFRFMQEKLIKASTVMDKKNFINRIPSKTTRDQTRKALKELADMLEKETGGKLPKNGRPQKDF